MLAGLFELFCFFQGDEGEANGVAGAELAYSIQVGGDDVAQARVAADGLGIDPEQDGLPAAGQLQRAGHDRGGDEFLAIAGPDCFG